MGRIGKSYWRYDWNSAAALQRFDRSLTGPQERALRHRVTAAVVSSLFVLGLIGWALSWTWR
jgi:hypothetical protein